MRGGELENLWTRLHAGDRLRLRDALRLRALAVPPFAGSTVFQTDHRGYVIATGTPESVRPLSLAVARATFERLYGCPVAAE